MRIGASFAALLLAALAGAAAIALVLPSGTDSVADWLASFAALTGLVFGGLFLFALPIGYLVRRFLEARGWESLAIYALAGLTTGALAGAILGQLTFVLWIGFPAAIASGLTLGILYWLLVRRHTLREDHFDWNA